MGEGAFAWYSFLGEATVKEHLKVILVEHLMLVVSPGGASYVGSRIFLKIRLFHIIYISLGFRGNPKKMGGTLQLVVLSTALALVFEFMAPKTFKILSRGTFLDTFVSQNPILTLKMADSALENKHFLHLPEKLA